MNFLRLQTVVLLIVLFSTSCRKPVNHDFPDFEKKLVVNSILVADSIIEVHVSLSDKMNYDSLAVLNNAEVSLYINDVFTEQLHYVDKGIYIASASVIKGNKYNCTVNYDELLEASAHCYIPIQTPITEAVLYENYWVNDEGELCPAVQFSINNNTSKSMYYNARIIAMNKHNSDSVNDWSFVEEFSIDVFSNEHESGLLINKNIEFNGNTQGTDCEFAYILELRTLNIDFYKYLKSVELYEIGRYPEFDSGIAAPYNLYSNVTGGYGIFTGYSSVYLNLFSSDKN
ncbi:MAG: DUF4249 domain-containing protein [Salinivirgaceae bacterium]|nr:DUF4249 domain-containing protein [Salinivirgaceae bacterium]